MARHLPDPRWVHHQHWHLQIRVQTPLQLQLCPVKNRTRMRQVRGTGAQAGPSSTVCCRSASCSDARVSTLRWSGVLTCVRTDPIADDAAEDGLMRFRRDMIQFCPIVHVPPTTSAKQLRQSRPYLWLSIMACTTRSMKQAHDIGDKLRHIVAQKLVVGFERSVDLLQGLMVFLQWPHCHRKDQPFLSLWTNICIAVAQDLGYLAVKGDSSFTYIKKFWIPKSGCKLHQQQFQRQQSQDYSMEDRRTLLALFMWTSM